MRHGSPPVVCIIGKKNSGKTGLTVALAAALTRRGRRVMTVKHGHGFQVDHPGKDSWRHRHEGGALRTVLASPGDFAVVGRWPQGEMELRELVDRFLPDADIVLAEGFKGAHEPKIEVFRADASDSGPLLDPATAGSRPLLALVTDRGEVEGPSRVFRVDDPGYLEALADLVEAELLEDEE